MDNVAQSILINRSLKEIRIFRQLTVAHSGMSPFQPSALCLISFYSIKARSSDRTRNTPDQIIRSLLPPANEATKVMFLHVSVILANGGGGVGIPAGLAGQGEVEGSGWGKGSPAHTQRGLRFLARGVSGPHPGGEIEGSGRGASPGPHPGGSPGHSQVCLSQHALRQTPQQMATAAGSMHPTGMHSCF